MNSPLKSLADAHRRLAGIYETAYEGAETVLQEINVLEEGLGTATAPTNRKTRGRGKAKATAAKATTAKATTAKTDGGRKRPKNDKTLPELVMDILSGTDKQGMKLAEIVVSVMGAGYKTSSKKAKDHPKDVFTQLVYQALKKLRDKEPDAYVDKNEDTKRYFLTNKGKKAA